MNSRPHFRVDIRFFAASLLFVAAAFFLVRVALAGTQVGPSFVVNSTADTDDGSCDAPGQGLGNHDCTLREALNAVSAYGDGATVTFTVSGTISLGSMLPEVNRNVTIDGSGQAIVLYGNNNVQIMQLYTRYFTGSYITANLNALTFSHGSTAIRGSFADANVTNCTFDSNNAGTSSAGGGIFVTNQSAPLNVSNSTFYNNASSGGSAINANSLAATNCYFYGNSASFTGQAGAIATSGSSVIRNCIFASSPNGINCSGGNIDAQNLSDDASCGSATQATLAQIKLDTLKANGGPTQTMALLAGSVAIGAGNSTIASAAPVNNLDQRGYGRIGNSDPTSDIGAFEYNTPGLPATAPVISPVSGQTYENSVLVRFTNSTMGTSFYYTTDGSTPLPGNFTTYLYSAPFLLTQSGTVSVLATASGYSNSPVVSASYTIQYPLDFWRIFVQGLPSNGSQDLANPSGDGIANLLKFAFNLAPNAGDLAKASYGIMAPDGTAGLPLITLDSQGRLTIEFARRKSSNTPGLSYVVETGADLASWSSLDLTSATVASIDDVWERVTVTDPTVAQIRFGRVRVVETPLFSADFNYYPLGATLYGSAIAVNTQSPSGTVQLTDEVNGGTGWMIFDGPGVNSYNRGFRALFSLQLGPVASGAPADGASFAVGDLPTSGWGESGPGTAHSLAVGFDTYNNGSGDGPGDIGVHVWVNGVHVASNPFNPYTNGVLVPVEVSYDVSSGVTVIFNGTTVLSNIPIIGFSFQSTDKFGMAARTGGQKERAVVDNVQIAPR